jgi:hypothetical protein
MVEGKTPVIAGGECQKIASHGESEESHERNMEVF